MKKKVPFLQKIRNFRNNFRFLQRNDLRTSCEVTFDDLLKFRRYLQTMPDVELPTIRTIEETVEMLVRTDRSIARYGDGEFLLMHGEGIPFQRADERLGKRLEEILSRPPRGCEVAIGRPYWYYDPRVLPYARDFAVRFMGTYGGFLDARLDMSRVYYDTMVTQFSQTMTAVDCRRMYQSFRKIWEGKRILIVCGRKSLDGIEHDIFDNAVQAEYIFGPSRDAWGSYAELLAETRAKAKGRLTLVMLGPTATVMAADLAADGHRAIDIGHFSKDYDAFCRGRQIGVGSAEDWFGT